MKKVDETHVNTRERGGQCFRPGVAGLLRDGARNRLPATAQLCIILSPSPPGVAWKSASPWKSVSRDECSRDLWIFVFDLVNTYWDRYGE